MKLLNFQKETLFKDFKSVKIKSNDEYNRKLYIVEHDPNKSEVSTRLHYINSDLSVDSVFSKEEISELISKLRYGESIIVSKKHFFLSTKYYVIDVETLNKYAIDSCREEYFSIREKPKRK